MDFFRWGPQFELGVMKIDAQHRQLVELVNRMYDAMTMGQGRQAVNGVLDELITYTVMHFKTEEELMDRHGYSEAADHKAKHAAMTKKVLALKKEADAGHSAVISTTVANFLKDWLEKHISGTDRKYAEFFKAQGVN